MEVLNFCHCTDIVQIYKNRAAGIEVCLANHPKYGKVAIKILDCGSEDSLRFYEREGRIALSIDHPSICRLYEQANIPSQSGYKYYLIMEQATSDLNREIKKRLARNIPWSEDSLANMLEQAVSALELAQQQSVCHRDLKPHNILICQDGRIKLADFGSANEAIHSSVVQTLTLQGTPIYLSPELREFFVLPEQQRPRKPRYNPYKSDVYSLALTFIHLIQLHPAMDLTRLEGLEEATRERVSLLEVSVTMKEILMAMLSKEEDMRPDFIMLKELLDAMLSGGIAKKQVDPLAENYLLAPGEEIQPKSPSIPRPVASPAKSIIQPQDKPIHPPQYPNGQEEVLSPPNILIAGVSPASAMRLTDILSKPLPQQVESSSEQLLLNSEKPAVIGAGRAAALLEEKSSIQDKQIIFIPEASLQGTVSIESMPSHHGDVEPELDQEPENPEIPGKCVICYTDMDDTALSLICGHRFCAIDCLEVLMLDRLKYFRNGFGELLCPVRECRRSIDLDYLQDLRFQGMSIKSYMRSKQSDEICMECKHTDEVRTLECSHKICDKCMTAWVRLAQLNRTPGIACTICKIFLAESDSNHVASIANKRYAARK